jgi:hypothetical protein
MSTSSVTQPSRGAVRACLSIPSSTPRDTPFEQVRRAYERRGSWEGPPDTVSLIPYIYMYRLYVQETVTSLVLLSGFSCEVCSADHVAYLHTIIRKEFRSPSPLCSEVLRGRLPHVEGLEGSELGQHEKLAVLCRKILQRKNPGI